MNQPAPAPTPCECPAAGFCRRHGIEKTPTLHRLCQTRLDFFQQWETGASPQHHAQNAIRPPGCRHRGQQIATVGLSCCGDTQETALLACALHRECTLDRAEPGVQFCGACPQRAVSEQERLIIHDGLSPGDIVVLTAALKALHENHPGQFLTDVRTPCPVLWENCRYVIPLADDEARHVDAGYSSTAYATIHKSNQRPSHFVEAYCAGLAAAIGIPAFGPLNWLEPSLRLSDLEKTWIPRVAGDYWIVNAGVKHDYTAKRWQGYQRVIDMTRERVQWVQIGAREHDHRPLEGSLDLIGQTDLRQLVRLVYHARGVLCGVTALAHLAHWIERKPGLSRSAAIVAGGRESPHWFAYPGQQVFHTIGELPCCTMGGCWRSRVKPLDVFPEHNNSLCERPAHVDGQDVGECMSRLDPAAVASLILRLSNS